MKKALLIALALVISAAFVAVVFARDPKEGPATTAPSKTQLPASSNKPVVVRMAPEKKGAKPKTHRYTGEVTKVDTIAKTIVVKSKKDEVTFSIEMATMKGWVREGDKVTVKYTEKEGKAIASSVTKERAKKEIQPGSRPIERPPAKKQAS